MTACSFILSTIVIPRAAVNVKLNFLTGRHSGPFTAYPPVCFRGEALRFPALQASLAGPLCFRKFEFSVDTLR
jgi:hypothetical protein